MKNRRFDSRLGKKEKGFAVKAKPFCLELVFLVNPKGRKRRIRKRPELLNH
jgi:hypothetical protein